MVRQGPWQGSRLASANRDNCPEPPVGGGRNVTSDGDLSAARWAWSSVWGEQDDRDETAPDFDPDIWIVSVEDRQGRHFLEDWLAA